MITLHVEATDEHLEAILGFLQDRGLDREQQLSLMDAALRWLRASESYAYLSGIIPDRGRCLVQMKSGDKPSLLSSYDRTEPSHDQERSVCPDARK